MNAQTRTNLGKAMAGILAVAAPAAAIVAGTTIAACKTENEINDLHVGGGIIAYRDPSVSEGEFVAACDKVKAQIATFPDGAFNGKITKIVITPSSGYTYFYKSDKSLELVHTYGDVYINGLLEDIMNNIQTPGAYSMNMQKNAIRLAKQFDMSKETVRISMGRPSLRITGAANPETARRAGPGKAIA